MILNPIDSNETCICLYEDEFKYYYICEIPIIIVLCTDMEYNILLLIQLELIDMMGTSHREVLLLDFFL